MKPTTFTAEAQVFASWCQRFALLDGEQRSWWTNLDVSDDNIHSYSGGNGCFEKRMLAPYLHCCRVAGKRPSFEDFVFLSQLEAMAHRRDPELPFLPVVALRKQGQGVPGFSRKISFSFLPMPPLHLISSEKRLIVETKCGISVSGMRDPEVSFSPLYLIRFDVESPQSILLAGSEAINNFFGAKPTKLSSLHYQIDQVDFRTYQGMMIRILEEIKKISGEADEMIHEESRRIFTVMMPYVVQLSDVLGGLGEKIASRDDGDKKPAV